MWLGVVVKCEDYSERRVVPTPVRVFSRGSAAGGNSLVVAVEVEGGVVNVEVEGGNVGPLLDGIIHGKR